MNVRVIVFVVCACLAAVGGASAADTAWLVTPTGGYHLFNSDAGVDSAPQAGARIGYSIIGSNLSESIEVQGGLDYLSTRRRDGTRADADVLLARVDLLYPFLPKKRTVPYLALGGGGMFVTSPGGNEQNPFISYGVTVRYYLTEWMALTADVRNTLVYRSGFQPGFEGGAGLTFVVGGEQKFKRVPSPRSSVQPKPGSTIKRLDELEGGDKKKKP